MYMYYLLGYRIVKECQERVLTALADNKISELATWGDQLTNFSGRVGKSQIFNILDDEVLYRVRMFRIIPFSCSCACRIIPFS